MRSNKVPRIRRWAACLRLVLVVPVALVLTSTTMAGPTVGWIALPALYTGATVSSKVYYVATTGDDANPGTLAAPWRHVQWAATVVPAGSTAYVRGGIYDERVTFKVSGSAAAGFTTFSNYPGELPILDGSRVGVPSGDTGMVLIVNRSYLSIQGFEIRNFRTSAADRVPVGVHIRDTAHHIKIRNNRIHHIETNYPGADDGNAHGIAVYGTSGAQPISNVEISGNELSNLKLGFSESLVVNGNVDTFTIANNVVHDNNNIGIDVIGFEGVSPNPATDQARNGIVRDNTIFRIDSYNNPAYAHNRGANGIYVDGGRNLIIERNTIYATDIGIELASEHAGKVTTAVTVRNNLVYRNLVTGLSLGGYDTLRGGTWQCTIINNTFFQNDTLQTGTGELSLQFDTRQNVLKNNIVSANSQGVLISNGYTQNTGNIVDHNLYSVAGGGEPVWEWKQVSYDSLAGFRVGTGNDAHGLYASPRFVNTSTPDLHLQSTSPAINAGENVAAVGPFDIDGQTRIQGGTVDMGADEFATHLSINTGEASE